MNENARREQFPLFTFVILLFVMGVIFGALMVNQLSLGQKQDLAAYLSHYFQTVDQTTDIESKSLFTQALLSNWKWIVLIGLLGLSVIGLPFIFILNFLKGALLGFTIKYLIDRLAWKGIVLAFVSVVPQSLIFLPAFIMMSVGGISFSLYVIKNRRLTPKCWHYLRMGFVMMIVAFVATTFEAFVTPRILSIVTPWLLAN